MPPRQALHHAVGGRTGRAKECRHIGRGRGRNEERDGKRERTDEGGDTSHCVSIARFQHPSRQRRDVSSGHLRYIRFVDFRLSDDQELLRASVREFAEAEMRPHVMEWDEAQHFPMDLLPKLADARADGDPVCRGSSAARAMSAVDYCICIEELARVCPAIALSVAAHNGLCSSHIAMFGTDAQKAKYLPRWCAARCSARGD